MLATTATISLVLLSARAATISQVLPIAQDSSSTSTASFTPSAPAETYASVALSASAVLAVTALATPERAKKHDWAVFRHAKMDTDRQRITSKYKNAGKWMRGFELATMPKIDVPDMPDDLASRASASGTQHLINYDEDSFYYGPVSIGSPGQVLNVDVDTGSADLWVQSNCTSCTSAQFKPSKSSTFKGSKTAFNIQYGSGSASGTLGEDHVSIAGLKVKNQYFGVVNKPSSDFEGTPSSGLIGMAFSSIAASGKPTFFENLMQANSSVDPMFSVFLTRQKTNGSSVCLGCFDTSKARSGASTTWLPVISKTYWTVAMTGAMVGSSHVVPATNISAAIDTGTTLVYVPKSFAKSLYAHVPGAKLTSSGYYTAPCSTFTSLTVSLLLHGSPFSINMDDFNLGRVSSGSSTCVAGILGLGDGFPDDLAIVGDEFLKSWYSTYQYSNGARVGLTRSIN